jgi:hypothetical protein
MNTITQGGCVVREEIGNYLCDSNRKCFLYDQNENIGWCTDDMTK